MEEKESKCGNVEGSSFSALPADLVGSISEFFAPASKTLQNLSSTSSLVRTVCVSSDHGHAWKGLTKREVSAGGMGSVSAFSSGEDEKEDHYRSFLVARSRARPLTNVGRALVEFTYLSVHATHTRHHSRRLCSIQADRGYVLAFPASAGRAPLRRAFPLRVWTRACSSCWQRLV